MKGFWRQLIQRNGVFTARLLRELARQVELAAPGPPHLSLILWSHPEGVSMADLSIFDTSGPLDGTVAFVDAEGNPTTADDVPAWSSSDPTVASVTASADGYSAVVTPTGALGATVIAVDSTRSSDGAGVHAQATLTVTASEEVSGDVTLSPQAAPTPEPPPEPTPGP